MRLSDLLPWLVATVIYGRRPPTLRPIDAIVLFWRRAPRLAARLRLQVLRPRFGIFGWPGVTSGGLLLGETYREGRHVTAEVYVPHRPWARFFGVSILSTICHEAAHIVRRSGSHGDRWRLTYRNIVGRVCGTYLHRRGFDGDKAATDLLLEHLPAMRCGRRYKRRWTYRRNGDT